MLGLLFSVVRHVNSVSKVSMITLPGCSVNVFVFVTMSRVGHAPIFADAHRCASDAHQCA